MNFLPKSDTPSKDQDELDLPAVRLLAVSEMSGLDADDDDDIKSADEHDDNRDGLSAENEIESELDMMLQEQMTALTDGGTNGSPGSEQFLSARILKIRDKQVTCTELKEQIAQGTTILRDLTAKADLIARYLDSAEVDLTQLETVETSSENLASFNRTLSQQYEQAKEKLEEQQTRLDFMESEKAKSRNTIEMARKEIARLLEFKREQAVEVTQIKSVLVKSENDRSLMEEKLEASEHIRKDLETESEKRLQRIHLFENLRKESEKTIAALTARNDELEQELQRSAISLSDMRLKQSDSNSRVLALQTQLEEMSHELSGLKRESESNARLKEKRIIELETRLTGGIHLSNEQPSIKKKVKKSEPIHAMAAVSDVENNAA